MARKQSKNTTKLANETGETIQLVSLSASGHRSLEITLASNGEHMKRSKPSDTGSMLEVYNGNNNYTYIVITVEDLLQNTELKIIKKPPPPAMYFEVVKRPRAH